MAKHLTLLRLHVKSAFLSIPRILLGTVLIGILVFLIGFTSHRIINSTDSVEPMNVAFVMNGEGDQYTDLFLNYANQIDSIKSTMTIRIMDYDSAYAGLLSGEIAAILSVPDRFMDRLIMGTTTPVEIIFAREDSLSSSAIFKHILKAAANDLGACEAGIYAAGSTLKNFGHHDIYLEQQSAMGQAYFTYVFDREVYFENEGATSMGSIPLAGFYTCTGIMIFLLLGGLTCSDLLKNDSDSLLAALRINRISHAYRNFCKFFAVGTVFYVIILALYGLAQLVGMHIDLPLPSWGPAQLTGLLAVILSVYAFIVLVFELCDNHMTGSIVLFTLSVLFIFASGGLVPLSLLPAGFTSVAGCIPSTNWLNILHEIYRHSFSVQELAVCCLWTVVFVAASSLINRCRVRR